MMENVDHIQSVIVGICLYLKVHLVVLVKDRWNKQVQNVHDKILDYGQRLVES